MKRIIIIAALCVSILIPVLRETGIVDLNLYTSSSGMSQTSAIGSNNIKADEFYNCHLLIKNKAGKLQELLYSYNDGPPLEVTADIYEVKYLGNYYTPIYKRFKIEYKCKVSTRDTGVGKAITGNIDGDIDMTIKGFCTIRKAKEIAETEVLKAVGSGLVIK